MIKTEGIINTNKEMDTSWNLMCGIVAQNKNRMKLKTTRNAFLGRKEKTCSALGAGELPKNQKYVSMHLVTTSL